MNTLRLLGLAASIAVVACDDSDSRVSGNSANTGNAQAAGRILTTDGSPATDARVTCRPDSLLPWETTKDAWHVVTDSTGAFLCADLPPGKTAIEASLPGSGLTSWRAIVLRADRTDTAPPDTIAPSGRIRVALPPGSRGTLVFSGLGISTPIQGDEELLIPGIPARWTGSVRLVRTAAEPAVVAEGIHVAPGATDSAGFTRTSARIRVALAGGLAAPLKDLPLLVRLDSSWDGFAASLDDGADIRLALADGTPLPVQIASWSRTDRSGEIWTMIDSLPVPGDSIELLIGWGVPVPPTTSSAPFGAARGWIAAWPLGDTGSTIHDLLGGFPGSPVSLASGPGVIGSASVFDGRLSGIAIPNSASGDLDFATVDSFTITCWAKLADFGTSRHVIGQGEFDYYIKFQKDWSVDDLWMAKNSRTSPNGGRYALEGADTARWTHLAMVARDSSLELYVDGLRADSNSLWDPDAAAKQAGLFRIGYTVDTAGEDGQHFHGSIDEAWAISKARPPAWIRFVARNQDPSAKRATIVGK